MNEKIETKSILKFLIDKIGDYSLFRIFFSQIEAITIWIFGGLPGIVGFVLRTLAYKLLFKRLDGFAWIQPNIQFVETRNLVIGKTFGANSGTYINAIGGISIGDYVLIGANVIISSGRHPIEGKYPPIFSRPSEPKGIIIEDDVWIGANTVIMPGVKLRKGTVVGACSVVTMDTEEYSVVVGAPARKIKSRI